MMLANKLRLTGHELKEHIPFTALGAVTGVIFMLIFKNLSHASSHTLFAIFHPAHVLLSAMVTAAMFKMHRKQTNIWIVIIVGYIGSIGIATLSDSIMPYIGEKALGLHIPSHSELHHHESEVEAADEHLHEHMDNEHHHEEHAPKVHLGFIEEWYLVNPAALLGILIAWFLPKTKMPHAAHVLISTWASSSHVLMTTQNEITFQIAMSMLLVLFLATWLPCCISDIVFPLMLTDKPIEHTH
ncbi:MAG: hypothetical protein JW806_04045 [Sedimentisphaerales bacterium]|nr:hypothetical protein [Sedimentisphaerales bacterium]